MAVEKPVVASPNVGYIAILFHLPWADVARVTLFILRLRFRVRTRFLDKKFKDFQGHISHFPRTPFSAKKSLESLSF